MRPTTIANAAVGFGFSCVASFRWGVGGSDRVFFLSFSLYFYFIPLLRTWKVLIEINFSQRMGKEKFCPFLDWKHAFITILNTKFMAKHNNIICTTRNGRLSTNIFIQLFFCLLCLTWKLHDFFMFPLWNCHVAEQARNLSFAFEFWSNS